MRRLHPKRRDRGIKTTKKSVTIVRTFKLAGMTTPHLPGTYELQIDEEPLDACGRPTTRR